MLLKDFIKNEEVIVFDTEYTSWEGSNERKHSGENEHREIIQIGAIKLRKENNKYCVIDKINNIGYIYVKPKINTVLSEYITNLTGITNQNIIDEGYTFEEALKIFSQFCGNNQVYSYGDDFNDVIVENINLYTSRFPGKFNYNFLNNLYENSKDIRKLFDYNGINTNKYTSGEVYKSLNIKVENENNHFAIWDCLSISLTINGLIKNNNITV